MSEVPVESIEIEPKRELLNWWGYLHTNGTIQAKRYFGPKDIQEARESPFCERVQGPFKAKDRNDALAILADIFKEF